MMFCPQTPGGELAKRWREVEARGARARGWRFRVVELGGRKLSSILCGDPWRGPCQKADCLVCRTGGRGACGRPGCTYNISCKTCKEQGPSTVPAREYDDMGEEEDQTLTAGGRQGQGEVGKPCIALYHGESGYSAYHRGLAHREGLERRRKKNLLWRHSLLYHGGEEAEFEMSVSAIHSSVLSRKLREGTDIISGDSDILMNSKLEFLQGAVPHTRRQWGL